MGNVRLGYGIVMLGLQLYFFKHKIKPIFLDLKLVYLKIFSTLKTVAFLVKLNIRELGG